MKCEDNKHMIANIYGLCVFFKLSPDNNYIIYTKNAVLIDISFSIETIKKIALTKGHFGIKGKMGRCSSTYLIESPQPLLD